VLSASNNYGAAVCGGTQPVTLLALSLYRCNLFRKNHRHGNGAQICKGAQLSHRSRQRTAFFQIGLHPLWAGEKCFNYRALLKREITPEIEKPTRKKKPDPTNGRKINIESLPES
jgi:hypothetical protein